MARNGPEPAGDEMGLEDDDPFAVDRPRSASAPRTPRRRRSAPVRPWDAPDDAPAEEWERASPGRGRGWDRKPVYWRARDSLYFEPLVALAIVVLLLVGLFAFTQNWPPAYVVESGSMQHGAGDRVGLINPGDMVLAEKLPNSSIVPYVTGDQDGVRTYGEFGDVVLYHPNGDARGTPIIHRTILFLAWNGAKKWYNATDLRGLKCIANETLTSTQLSYATDAGKSCRTTDLATSLALYNVGFDDKHFTLDLAVGGPLGDHSGYLTMGDNNPGPDQNGTSAISSLVEPGWIIGVARGMLPWFGAFKLLLEGNAGNVSSTSWQFLGLSLIVAILAAFGIHYALRTEGIETPLRRREEDERAASSEPDDDEAPPSHRFLGAIRAWREGADDAADAPDRSPPKPRSRPPPRSPQDRSEDPRGRSRSHVHRPVRRRRNDDET